jgi:hypothetical protein
LAYTPQSWRRLYSRAEKQMSQRERLAWCENSRRIMQARLIELSSEGDGSRSEVDLERSEIENALRKVWRIEQKARKTQR